MNHRVTITDCQSALPIDADRLKEIVLHAVACEQLSEAEISVAIVDDRRSHELNRTHLQHDYPTDVLSFLLDRDPDGECDPLASFPGRGRRVEGEVVVNAETAVRESDRFGWSAADELSLYVVHGVLHLCGYDDSCDEFRSAMRRREREVLKNWSLTPNYNEERTSSGRGSEASHPPSE